MPPTHLPARFLLICLGLTALAATACESRNSPHETQSGSSSSCPDEPRWGAFSSLPELQLDGGGPDIDILKANFSFLDKTGKTWTARAGLGWDGASIPRVCWSLIGAPKNGCHRLASIVHDEYYKRREAHQESRQAVDEMFYQACRAKGVGRAKAGVMYYALRWFGQSWDSADVSPSSMALGEQLTLLRRLELELERGESSGVASLAAALDEDGELDALDQLPPPEQLAALLPER